MRFEPKVSILIPVYNGANFIKQAIDSALQQTYKNIEIIVINDGSTDDGATEKIVKKYGSKVKYIKKENGGVASALNTGIKESTGDYVSWLSHDDVYNPDKVEKEINVLDKLENKKTIIFSNFHLINEESKIFSTTKYTANIKKEKLCQNIYPVIKGTVNGCTILIHKECFEKVGYFDESLRTTNDYEMWIRLFGQYPSYFIEEPLIKYRIHPNQDTNKNPVYITECNVLWKNIINSITPEMIEQWGFDVFNVYMTLYIQMKNSKFTEAAELAHKKSIEIYRNITPEITIAMPCYNSSRYLKKAIDSILAQTYCNFRLIAIDDHSTDNTKKMLEEYKKQDFRVEVLTNEFEKGVSGAMNTAIKHARGKYFTRMDSDDISIATRIEKQYEFLENHKDFGICSVNISMLDELDNVYNPNVYPDSKIPHEWTFLWTNPIPNAPCMYRTDFIKENKINFSKLKTAEDYEFLSHIIIKNKVYMIPDTQYLYRYKSNSLFNSNLKETFKNSVEISKNFFEKVTKENAPDYYEFLTFFHNNGESVVVEDIKVVNRFLLKVAKQFKEFFMWTDEEYDLVVDSIPEILERYVIVKNPPALDKKKDMNKDSIWKKIKRVLAKVKKSYKEYGFKVTMKKIKDKIWRR